MSTIYTAPPAAPSSYDTVPESQYGELPVGPKKESVFSVVVIAILVILVIMVIYSASRKDRKFPDSQCKLDGFADLTEAYEYISDPQASGDVQMTRCLVYALLSDQCNAKCTDILLKAKQLAGLFKVNNLAKNVDELERYLLLVWNGCVSPTSFPADLSAYLLNFQSYRQRLSPPHLDATLNDLRTMLYVRQSYSPFFIDCGRSNLAPKRYFAVDLLDRTSCRKNCGTEPNYPTTFWSLNKFETLAEADAYVNDPAITDECRLVRAAMLVPIANIGAYNDGRDVKNVIRSALLLEGGLNAGNNANSNKSAIKTVADLENYMMGAARTLGFNRDMDTLRRLMYTTELGNPARASNGDSWFMGIACLPEFRDESWAKDINPDCQNWKNSFGAAPWVIETNARSQEAPERLENRHNGNRFASERSSVV